MNRGRLQLTPEEMREFGYRIIDLLVEHYASLDRKRVAGRLPRRDLEAKLREPVPEQGEDPAAVLAQAERDFLSLRALVNHPRFFAFVPGPGNYVGAMADALAAGLNIFQGTWISSAGPSAVELVTIGWLRELCGLPAGAGGLFVSGGSMANLTALAAARRVKLEDHLAGAVVYFSDQTHASVERALRVLGFRREQFRKLPADGDFRLPLAALREHVAADRAAGLRPFCVVANAGTTNTGAVDPLLELARFCRAEDLWLHVDGAYGAAAVLCPRGKALLEGLGQVDSLSLDPHKWLFQPYEMGCVLVRNQSWLRSAFQILPDYMQDAHRLEEFDFCDHGIQLTRSFRALKLWMSFKVFGLAAFREAIERGFTLAEIAEDSLRKAGCWEVVTSAQMGIVSFRYRPGGGCGEECERVNRRLAEAMYADGFAMLSSTVLGGRTALRMCTINPRTSEEDIRATVARLSQVARRLASAE